MNLGGHKHSVYSNEYSWVLILSAHACDTHTPLEQLAICYKFYCAEYRGGEGSGKICL